MVFDMPVHFMKGNAVTRRYRAWLDRCVVLSCAEPTSPLNVETDLKLACPGYPWIARPIPHGKFLCEAPLDWRLRGLEEGEMHYGGTFYTVESATAESVRGLVEVEPLWIAVRGIPFEYSDLDSVRNLFTKYGYVSQMDWYNSENLDLRFLRLLLFVPDRAGLPPQMAVIFVDEEVVEGMAVVSVDVEGPSGISFVPGPQNINEIDDLSEIIREMQASAGYYKTAKGKDQLTDPSYIPTDEEVRLMLIKLRLKDGYNGKAGAGRVWVHPELVDEEVRAVQLRRLRARQAAAGGSGSGVGIGTTNTVLAKRGRGRPCKDGSDGRVAQLGPRLGNSTGVQYVDFKLEIV